MSEEEDKLARCTRVFEFFFFPGVLFNFSPGISRILDVLSLDLRGGINSKQYHKIRSQATTNKATNKK